jgi:hypothetical protein
MVSSVPGTIENLSAWKIIWQDISKFEHGKVRELFFRIGSQFQNFSSTIPLPSRQFLHLPRSGRSNIVHWYNSIRLSTVHRTVNC